MEQAIKHVSETALLVAACRAEETERPDGLVRDPFASRLAGDRGYNLLRTLRRSEWMPLGIGLRSRFLDELLLRAIDQGTINTVLNLGAGLDTRPWRLEVPQNLRWIEVDFPEMLEYKADRLQGVQPRCRLESATADLNDSIARRRVLDVASAQGSRCLVMAEGLLLYLSAETVRALALETAAQPGFRFWLFEVVSLHLMRVVHGTSVDQIENVRAGNHLEAEQILALMKECGWAVAERRSMLTDAWQIARERIQAIARNMAERHETAPAAPPLDDPSGVWLWRPGTERIYSSTSEKR